MLSAKLSSLIVLAGLSHASLVASDYHPFSWSIVALLLWLAFLGTKGLAFLEIADLRHLSWGFGSIAAFVLFLLYDPTFQGWGDTYFWCAPDMRYCTCDLDWNLDGWLKALVLWNFVLASVLCVQKLIIEVGLNGLLPGEEVVTKDSFISICWRLIPYCLNNWEKKWGAECTSMMFELPHFALELLVVLPIVQILCSRLKVLNIPAAQHMRPGGADPDTGDLAPALMQGVWQHLPGHDRFLTRLRYNLRALLMVAGVIVLAVVNAIIFPVGLERQILVHPRAEALVQAATQCESDTSCWAAVSVGLSSNPFSTEAQPTCPIPDPLRRSLFKHASEILKMQHPVHRELLPLVELGLACLRMSCEGLFLLVSVFVAYLLYFTKVPRWFKRIVRINHRLSKLFQKAILYTFPAVCWAKGAGVIFSSFVSLVFWMAPAKRAYHGIRSAIAVVQPLGLKDASIQEVENMNNNCTVCWLPMAAAGASYAPSRPRARHSVGKALACGHAFHGPCIERWLKQCHGQNRLPTCPLCNRAIQLQVNYQLPKLRRMHARSINLQSDEEEEEGRAGTVLMGLAAPDVGPPQPMPFQTEHTVLTQQQDLGQNGLPLPSSSILGLGSVRDLEASSARLHSRSSCSREWQDNSQQFPTTASSTGRGTGSSNTWRDGPPLPLRLTQGPERRTSLKHRVRRAAATAVPACLKAAAKRRHTPGSLVRPRQAPHASDSRSYESFSPSNSKQDSQPGLQAWKRDTQLEFNDEFATSIRS